jgi:hypothetical protein
MKLPKNAFNKKKDVNLRRERECLLLQMNMVP